MLLGDKSFVRWFLSFLGCAMMLEGLVWPWAWEFPPRWWMQTYRYAANTEVDPDTQIRSEYGGGSRHTDTQRIRRWIQTRRYAAFGSRTEGATTPGVPHPPRAKTETRQNIPTPRAQVSCSKLFTSHCREISLRANWTNYPPTLTHTHTHTSDPTGKGILAPKATKSPPTS